ncbi:MAG: dienelactone hydrolase family protein [Sciscionella sp.]
MSVPGQVMDPSAVVDRDVIIDAPAGRITGYLATPRTAGPWPGMVVIHEAFGMVEHIRDVARRLANRGFAALAPDLYSRVEPFDPSDRESAMAAMFALSDADVVADLAQAAAVVRQFAGEDVPVGCIGFCSGGRQTLLAACSSDAFDVAVDCWGGWITRAGPDAERTPNRPTPVLELASQLRCPLFAASGVEDRNPSPEVAEELRRRVAGSPNPADIRVYPEAGHAFFADYRETYREEPAAKLWHDVTAFLDEHLRHGARRGAAT